MDKTSLEHLLARGTSGEKIARRFGKHPSTVSYWMAKHGLEAPNRDKHAPAPKCILLCSNRHAEVEGGIIASPATVLAARPRTDSP
jgi:transposase-like protein